jgi:hypothetical protein
MVLATSLDKHIGEISGSMGHLTSFKEVLLLPSQVKLRCKPSIVAMSNCVSIDGLHRLYTKIYIPKLVVFWKISLFSTRACSALRSSLASTSEGRIWHGQNKLFLFFSPYPYQSTSRYCREIARSIVGAAQD